MQRAQHARTALPVGFEGDRMGATFAFDEVRGGVLRGGNRDNEDVCVPSRASQCGTATGFVVKRGDADVLNRVV